jgi:urea transport system substrate-binding protein
MMQPRIPRKILALVVTVVIVVGVWLLVRPASSGAPIRVGVLHSLTGTMAVSERSVVDATLFAVEEVNRRGGLLGRKIMPLVVDGQSDWPTFAREAERLVTREQVTYIFGCWTSASRKVVKPVVERYQGLLFYPVQYEGIEASPNIIYTGAAPNQQLIPAVKWASDNLGKRFYLVGSDYIFPRMAHTIIREVIAALEDEVVGEHYLPLGAHDVQAVIDDIARTRPAVILNTINGSSNLTFFRQLRAAGINSQTFPTISFSITEEELRSMNVADMAGDYAAWNYFQSVEGARNQAFIENIRSRYGPERVVTDPMEAAYIGVHLWAQAVELAGTVALPAVRTVLHKRPLV